MTSQKKVLFLGGRPIGSVEMVSRLKELGYYVIVADYLAPIESPAKLISDEAWQISTSEVDTLKKKMIEENVGAVMTGVHEFNINRMLDLCEALNLPCYCNRETWKYCDNKMAFKQLCFSHDIPVSPVYSIEELEHNSGLFPVIVKPVDGSGSRGFHICNTFEELKTYQQVAVDFSPSRTVLIEKFIPYNAVIIHYTMINGKCYYSGMSDKISVKFQNTGASVMGIQTFPSVGESQYLSALDTKARKMFENAGFRDGPVWIEAFYDGDSDFIFNEMGYRFGGSLTYYPVRYFYGIDQLDLMIENATGDTIPDKRVVRPESKYCILPVHISPGIISHIYAENLTTNSKINALVPVHYLGDEIKDWGSAQQVFAYAHILYNEKDELKSNVSLLLDNLKVLDENGDNMIHTLFDITQL